MGSQIYVMMFFGWVLGLLGYRVVFALPFLGISFFGQCCFIVAPCNALKRSHMLSGLHIGVLPYLALKHGEGEFLWCSW